MQLTNLARADLAILFRKVDNAELLRDQLREILPRLVALYGSAAATLAADWYDDLREAERVRSRFIAIPTVLPDTDRTDALARWGVGPLFQADPEPATALEKTAGGLQRIIADASRQTVLGSITEDPEAVGWSRATAGGCDFCQLIAGRGAVYSAETADFASHDSCHCVAVPEYGEGRQVRAFTPSQRFSTQEQRDVHNARLRAALNSNT